MQPLSIGKFILGIITLGLMWLALKPGMDEVIALMPSVTTMTDTEVVVFELSIWLVASILLIWLVICLTRRRRD